MYFITYFIVMIQYYSSRSYILNVTHKCYIQDLDIHIPVVSGNQYQHLKLYTINLEGLAHRSSVYMGAIVYYSTEAQIKTFDYLFC